MADWTLGETIETRAGTVAAGHAGDGPPLILAHGWPWSSFSWHRIIPELAKRFRVHWYDMPGYGQSEKRANQRTSLDVQGEVFVEVLTHWDIPQPIVVAHDFGGATTLRAHLLHGYDFSKFVLMNVVAMRPWGSAFFDHVGQHVEAFQGLPPHIHGALVEAYIRGTLVNELADDDLDRLVAPWLTADGANRFYRQFAEADAKYTTEVEPAFANVRCDVKILWGEDDPWIPLERGRSLWTRMPGATFETIPGVGHLPQLEAPSEVLSRLTAFIDA